MEEDLTITKHEQQGSDAEKRVKHKSGNAIEIDLGPFNLLPLDVLKDIISTEHNLHKLRRISVGFWKLSNSKEMWIHYCQKDFGIILEDNVQKESAKDIYRACLYLEIISHERPNLYYQYLYYSSNVFEKFKDSHWAQACLALCDFNFFCCGNYQGINQKTEAMIYGKLAKAYFEETKEKQLLTYIGVRLAFALYNFLDIHQLKIVEVLGTEELVSEIKKEITKILISKTNFHDLINVLPINWKIKINQILLKEYLNEKCKQYRRINVNIKDREANSFELELYDLNTQMPLSNLFSIDESMIGCNPNFYMQYFEQLLNEIIIDNKIIKHIIELKIVCLNNYLEEDSGEEDGEDIEQTSKKDAIARTEEQYLKCLMFLWKEKHMRVFFDLYKFYRLKLDYEDDEKDESFEVLSDIRDKQKAIYYLNLGKDQKNSNCLLYAACEHSIDVLMPEDEQLASKLLKQWFEVEYNVSNISFEDISLINDVFLQKNLEHVFTDKFPAKICSVLFEIYLKNNKYDKALTIVRAMPDLDFIRLSPLVKLNANLNAVKILILLILRGSFGCDHEGLEQLKEFADSGPSAVAAIACIALSAISLIMHKMNEFEEFGLSEPEEYLQSAIEKDLSVIDTFLSEMQAESYLLPEVVQEMRNRKEKLLSSNNLSHVNR